jgi:hypothetical protein
MKSPRASSRDARGLGGSGPTAWERRLVFQAARCGRPGGGSFHLVASSKALRAVRCPHDPRRRALDQTLLDARSLDPRRWSFKSQSSEEARNCPFPASRGGSIHHRPLPSGSRMAALTCATPNETRRSIRLVPPMLNQPTLIPAPTHLGAQLHPMLLPQFTHL